MSPTPPSPEDLAAVFAHIEQQRERSLERLFAYLRMPSISAQGVGIAETAAFLESELDTLGFEARLLDTPGWPLVFGQRLEDPALPTLLLYGHYDVQPPEPFEAWVTPPFEPTIRDGRIYARGVADNKGQHFAQLLALESLLAVRGRLGCNVKVLLEGEEEIGSPWLADAARAHRELLAADLVVTADGPVHDSGRACIRFGVRGMVSFELRARGAAHDLHSGNWGGVAPNPLWTLVHLLATMKDPQGRITIEGLLDDILPASDLERRALDELPLDLEAILADLELTRLDAPEERPFYHRLALWPTLTINGLHGGYGGPGTKTVLPSEAVAKCDIRLVEAQRVEDVFAKIEAHVARHAPPGAGVQVTLIRHGGMEPSRTPLDSPFTEPLRRAVTLGQGEEPLLIPAMGGSLPDYVFTKLLATPAFVIPYANPDEANHAPNENLEVARFFRGIRTGAAVVRAIGQMAVGGERERREGGSD